MLVATVTAPARPAWAMIAASRAWFLAFSTSCGTPARSSSLDSSSDFSTEAVPTRTGWPFVVALGDVVDDRVELGVLGLVDQVALVGTSDRLVRRNRDDAELVGLTQLGGLGLRGAGHAGQPLVEPEVVLQRDRGQRLVLGLDLDALLGLDRLVHALVVAAAVQHPAGELVDDEHLAGDHDVVAVLLVEVLRLQRVVQESDQRGVDGLVEVVDAERLLDLGDALLGDADGALGLVDLVVAVAGALAGDLLATAQARAPGGRTPSTTWTTGRPVPR